MSINTGLVFSAAVTSAVGLVGVFQRPSSVFHQRMRMLCLLERERCGKQWRREVCSAFWESRAAVYKLNPENFSTNETILSFLLQTDCERRLASRPSPQPLGLWATAVAAAVVAVFKSAVGENLTAVGTKLHRICYQY